MVIAVKAHKLAYMALPKAGCSSVKEALARIDPDATLPPDDQIDVNTWHAIYPTTRFRPHRWEKYETPDWFRFCVVRDPFKRLMSCYTNRVLQFNELKNSIKIRDGRDYLPDDLPVEPDPDFFFQNLQHYVRASSAIKHHALGAWLFLGKDLGRYSRVYRTAELPKLAADLSDRTGLPVTIPRGNASEVRLTPDDLKGETIAALTPFLVQEYAYLRDYYDNPLS
jgi:hypothetical protein